MAHTRSLPAGVRPAGWGSRPQKASGSLSRCTSLSKPTLAMLLLGLLLAVWCGTSWGLGGTDPEWLPGQGNGYGIVQLNPDQVVKLFTCDSWNRRVAAHDPALEAAYVALATGATDAWGGVKLNAAQLVSVFSNEAFARRVGVDYAVRRAFKELATGEGAGVKLSVDQLVKLFSAKEFVAGLD